MAVSIGRWSAGIDRTDGCMPGISASRRSGGEAKHARSVGLLGIQARWRASRVPLGRALGEAEVAVLAELDPVRRGLAEALAPRLPGEALRARGVEERMLAARGRRSILEDGIVALVSRGGASSRETRHAMALLAVLERIDPMMSECVAVAAMRDLMRRDTRSLAELLACLTAMGDVADEQIAEAGRMFSERDLSGLTALRNRDRKLCELNRRCLAAAENGTAGNGARNGANLATLVARAVERIGEGALAVGRQAAFLETGVAPPLLEADLART